MQANSTETQVGGSLQPDGSAPSNWYKAYEMEDLLKASPIPQASDNYDFCIWLSGHMNLALQKGYEMAEVKAQNH